jgi:NADH:ubiquinone oxidoreductase subunit 5 (subunit L)/multisubunit Na+/H+ antiporter MnhA subunit
MGMEQAWVIPALPAASAAVLILFGKYLPRKGDWLSVLAIFGSLVVFLFVLKDLTDALAAEDVRPGARASTGWLRRLHPAGRLPSTSLPPSWSRSSLCR